MKILIAGCGDVGVALAAPLIASGHEVFALRRSPPDSNPVSGLRWLSADLCDPGSLTILPGEIDAVVYTTAASGRTPEAYRRAYVDGVRVLLAEIRAGSPECAHFIFVSSTGVYGEDKGELVNEDTPACPKGFTGSALLEGEDLVQTSGIPSTIVRFGGIYGPGRNWLISKVRSGDAEILEDYVVYTNRIHRDDCAGVLQHLLERGPDGNRVYIGVDDEPVDRSQVFEFLAKEMGVELRKRNAAEDAPDDLPPAGKQCSNKRLKDTGYSFIFPTYVEGYRALLEEG